VPPSLLDDPARPPDRPTAARPAPPAAPAPASPPPPSPSRAPRGRRGLAVVVIVSSLLGGAAASGVLLATGVVSSSDAPAVATSVGTDADGATSGASPIAAGAGLNAAALYAKASPGVVDITAIGASVQAQQSPFGEESVPQSTATGTGFVTGRDGYILTAAHVVDGASTVRVTFQDGTKRPATITGKDDATDVALLKVDPSGLKLHPLTLGSSASLRAGDALAAIGDPFGYERSISTGIVSGLDRTIRAPNGFTVAHAIQTDAALNPGNSGGPILDAAGRVIGIADQIATGASANATNAGVGFAVPIDLVKSELAALRSAKTPRHAYLGVSMTSADGSGGGALVGMVTAGGPAADAGLRPGDTVTAIDGKKVADSNALISVIAGHEPGDRVVLTVRRGGDSSDHTVTLGTQPSTAQAAGAP
jgi:putative serine protease PepD